jgi:HEAT repeat protein
MMIEALTKLAEGASPSAVEVGHLSGLSGADLAAFRAGWLTLPVERRQAIVRLAVELAENDVQLDFVGLFRACLSDPDPVVRSQAIDGLWEDEEFRTADLLATILRQDPAEAVRTAAALGLARFTLAAVLGSLYAPSAARVRGALLAAAQDRRETVEVRRRVLEALGVFEDQSVVDLIEAGYADPSSKMRASALYAMGRNGDERWLPTILGELESEDPELRYEAARAAGGLENHRAVIPLIGRLSDEDLEVRLAAIGSLAAIGGDVARRALDQCARSKEAAVRQAAREALDEMAIGTDPLSISPFLDDSTRTV